MSLHFALRSHASIHSTSHATNHFHISTSLARSHTYECTPPIISSRIQTTVTAHYSLSRSLNGVVSAHTPALSPKIFLRMHASCDRHLQLLGRYSSLGALTSRHRHSHRWRAPRHQLELCPPCPFPEPRVEYPLLSCHP